MSEAKPLKHFKIRKKEKKKHTQTIQLQKAQFQLFTFQGQHMQAFTSIQQYLKTQYIPECQNDPDKGNNLTFVSKVC